MLISQYLDDSFELNCEYTNVNDVLTSFEKNEILHN